MALDAEMVKSLVMFRYRTLDAACRNARQKRRLGHVALGGRSGWSRDDATFSVPGPRSKRTTSTGHRTGMEVWLGLRAASNPFSCRAGSWTRRAAYNNAKDGYEIHGPVSLDESKIGVTDDPRPRE